MTTEISAIVVNGDPFEIAAGGSLLDLLEALDHHPRTVAIELNGEVVPRARFGEVALVGGDRVEIVRFVQGGTPEALERRDASCIVRSPVDVGR